jgi:hypothetical protein
VLVFSLAASARMVNALTPTSSTRSTAAAMIWSNERDGRPLRLSAELETRAAHQAGLPGVALGCVAGWFSLRTG